MLHRFSWPAGLALLLLPGPGWAQAPAEKPAVVPGGFEEAARRAAAARESDQAAEAIRWYREAVRSRPDWDEGWWYVGALSYERGEWGEASRAFARFVELKPDSGPAWALRGLSDFKLEAYDAALRHLAKGLSLGTVGNADIRDVVYHHMALLRIRASQFELAVEPLSALARAKSESPPLVAACGLLLLRLPLLPSEVKEDERELVQAAGRAAYATLGLKDEAGALFEELLKRYPDTPNLHYGYGGYLLQKGEGARAIEVYRREIEIDPRSVYARLEIAFELMRRGEHAAAAPYAEAGVRLAPGLFAAHHALGRVLVETGEVERGIAELEESVRLAPESPDMRAALARAYVQGGRRADAERERETYKRLQLERERVRLPGFAREDTLSPEPPP